MTVKTERFAVDHEERFECGAVVLAFEPESDGKCRFTATAYSGVDVSRGWGRMVINSAGLKRDERMGMLIEHDDLKGVAVCDGHTVDPNTGKVSISGYFLSDKASKGEASVLIAKAREGWPFKMSVGVRFKKWHFLEDGADETVNGRKFKGLSDERFAVIDEAQLFETSFIHVSPADWDTNAEVMRLRAQERKSMANTPENKAAMSETLAGGEASNVVDIAKLREQARAEVLAEIKAKEEAALAAARAEQAKKDAEELATLRAEKKAREESIASLRAAGFSHTGLGFDAGRAEAPSDARYRGMKPEDRMAAEFSDKPVLEHLWDGESRLAYPAMLRYENRRAKNGQALMRESFVETMATAIIRQARNVPGGLARLGIDERLAVGMAGKVGPDLSRVVVKGFIGSFYNAYDPELNPTWATQLSFEVESSQESEVVRWLGASPQFQLWKGERIAQNIPIFTQIMSNSLYEATLQVDKFDFNNQKFGLINRVFANMGAVVRAHWNLLLTALLEANPLAYDGQNFFDTDHTLGGQSGTMANDLTSANFASLAVNDVANVTQTEAALILLQVIPQFYTFKFNNGEPMNGEAKRFGVIVPAKFLGAFNGAVKSERLETGQSNPIYGMGIEVIPNARLTAANNYIYPVRLDAGMRQPFLRAEPAPIEMAWLGEGTTYAFEQHKYATGLESTRTVAPGAWESILRCTLSS